jgi:hypothetical protein
MNHLSNFFILFLVATPLATSCKTETSQSKRVATPAVSETGDEKSAEALSEPDKTVSGEPSAPKQLAVTTEVAPVSAASRRSTAWFQFLDKETGEPIAGKHARLRVYTGAGQFFDIGMTTDTQGVADSGHLYDVLNRQFEVCVDDFYLDIQKALLSLKVDIVSYTPPSSCFTGQMQRKDFGNVYRVPSTRLSADVAEIISKKSVCPEKRSIITKDTYAISGITLLNSFIKVCNNLDSAASGVVLDDSGKPISETEITVSYDYDSAEPLVTTTRTDSTGKFQALAASRVRGLKAKVCAQKDGYDNPVCKVITLSNDQRNNDIGQLTLPVNHLPTGRVIKVIVDKSNNPKIVGWAKDQDNADVEVVIRVGEKSAKATTGQNRSEACTEAGNCNAGFSIQTKDLNLADGTHSGIVTIINRGILSEEFSSEVAIQNAEISFTIVNATNGDDVCNGAEGPRTFLDSQGRTIVPMCRVYNVDTGAHFFTTNVDEALSLDGGKTPEPEGRAFGFTREGVAFYVYPEKVTGTEGLNRLYNPNNGRHYYTSSGGETAQLVLVGWKDEGISGFLFTSAQPGTSEIHKMYNRITGAHFFTINGIEANYLLGLNPAPPIEPIWQKHTSVGFMPNRSN